MDTTQEIGTVYKVTYSDGSTENLDDRGDVKYAIVRHEMDNLTDSDIEDALNEEYGEFHTGNESFWAYDIINALGDVGAEMQEIVEGNFDNVVAWPEDNDGEGYFQGAYWCDINLVVNDEWLTYIDGERPETDEDPAALAMDEDNGLYVVHRFEGKLLVTRLD